MTKNEMFNALLADERDEFGANVNDPRVQELVELRVEDHTRKGCKPEHFIIDCRGCAACVNGRCPVIDWETRNPEYANDELAQKIKNLERELYGWHKPHTHKTETIQAQTVAELIEKLKEFSAEDIVISDVKLRVKL